MIILLSVERLASRFPTETGSFRRKPYKKSPGAIRAGELMYRDAPLVKPAGISSFGAYRPS
jgi:hypothetical protein